MNVFTKTLGLSANKPVPPTNTKITPASPAAVAQYLRENGDVADKYEAQENVIARRQALTNANHNLIRDEQAEAGNAQSNKARTIESHAKAGMAVPPDELLSLEESITKTKQRVRDLMADSTKDTEALVGDREANKVMVAYLPYLAAWNPEAQPVEVKLPKGDLTETISTQRAERARLLGSRKGVRNAPPSADEAEAGLLAELADLARDGAPRVSFSGGRASLRMPMVGVDAEPNSMGGDPGILPVTGDAHGLAAYFFHDQIAEIIKSEVAAHYADIPMVLSAAQKRQKHAEIDAAILEVERIECAAVWALRDQGISFAFRPDTDPRALLGVDGPAPRRPRE